MENGCGTGCHITSNPNRRTVGLLLAHDLCCTTEILGKILVEAKLKSLASLSGETSVETGHSCGEMHERT